MKHAEARNHLDEFATRQLAPDDHRAVQAHVDECALCADWLATYRTLQAGLSRHEHPDAGALAEYAFEPANLAQRERADLEDHLRACGRCRADYRATRLALDEARPDFAERTAGHATLVQRTWRPALGLAAAASLIALVLLTVPVAMGPGDRTIANEVLSGSQIIEAEERLFATNVQIEESAQVALRADSAVTLGAGFSVKQGAKVAMGPRHPKQES